MSNLRWCGVGPLKSHSNILLDSDLDKANLLNSYFESVFTTDNGVLPPFLHVSPPLLQGCRTLLSPLIPFFSSSIISKLIQLLAPMASPSIFYRNTASSLAFPISVMFRSILDLHIIPDEWKLSVITPIFKKRFAH